MPVVHAPARTESRARLARRVRRFVGCFYLTMAGINAGIVFADAGSYRHFADASYLPFVTRMWQDVVMAHPAVWGLLLAGGEIVLGTLLLHGGRAAQAGWLGVIAFHLLLMTFGFGIWLWSVPVLALLIPAAHADWPALTRVSREGRRAEQAGQGNVAPAFPRPGYDEAS
ncbi:hypothetical protein [Nocardioides sp.]|uniref:hypothetical protein n=1 Tax=Nocardioides sp. TaxID=35761 RepID=UPI002D808DAE|nr:hypothetical protein [Nocardioides sp.]HET8961335.1 hypothetical protein [Nocardioides sp.]